MKPVSPVIPGENHNEVIVAEDQEEYQNLPSIPMQNGILTRWELNDEEKQIVAKTGSIYVYLMTFGQPIQPILLQVEKPELKYT